MSQVQKLRSTIAYLTDTRVSCHWVIVIIQGVIIHDRMFVDQQGSIMPMTTHSVNILDEIDASRGMPDLHKQTTVEILNIISTIKRPRCY